VKSGTGRTACRKCACQPWLSPAFTTNRHQSLTKYYIEVLPALNGFYCKTVRTWRMSRSLSYICRQYRPFCGELKAHCNSERPLLYRCLERGYIEYCPALHLGA